MTQLNQLRNDTATALAIFTHNLSDEASMTQNVDAAADVLDAIAEYTIAKATQQHPESVKIQHDLKRIPSKTAPQTPRPPAA